MLSWDHLSRHIDKGSQCTRSVRRYSWMMCSIESCALNSSRYHNTLYVMTGALLPGGRKRRQIHLLRHSLFLGLLVHSLTFSLTTFGLNHPPETSIRPELVFRVAWAGGCGLGRIRLERCPTRRTKHARQPLWIKVYKMSEKILKWRSYL